nr:methanethiol oxidase-like [Lytechinus pictus]
MANPNPRVRRLFSHPTEAMQYGDREEILYVTCSPSNLEGEPDVLLTLDVNSDSDTYGKVIHRLPMPHIGDEISRLGWNTCMSCYGEDESASHGMLVVTCLRSSRIYIIDVATNPRVPAIKKIIEDELIRERSGLTNPMTSHCLGFGQVMVSAHDNGQDTCDKGGFIVLEGDDLDVKERWDSSHDSNVFSYDFWYQLLTHNVIISSTGWGRRDIFNGQTSIKDAISQASESRSIHVWDFEKRTVIQAIDLGVDGAVPLAARFLHDAEKSVGFVSSASGSTIYKFFKTSDDKWDAKKVISLTPGEFSRDGCNSLPAVTSDLVLSLDDRFLYCSNWMYGDVCQYDVTDTDNPKLVGQVHIGGDHDKNANSNKGRRIYGGPNNMTLSLDGRRLYVTTSLFSQWDAEIYPDTVKNGSSLVMINTNQDEGGLSLDQDLIVELSKGDGSSVPLLAKEMRYPGGDCTSDIFLSMCSFSPSKKVVKE